MRRNTPEDSLALAQPGGGAHRLGLLAVLALVLAVTSARRQPSAQEAPAPASGPEEDAGGGNAAKKRYPPLFYLRDASKVAGSLQTPSLTVSTLYGTLKVPVRDLVRVRFATRVAPEIAAKVETELELLQSEDYDEREAAFKNLQTMGAPALPGLEKLIVDATGETRERAEELIETIHAAVKKSSPKPRESDDEMPALAGEKDEIVTRRFTIRGRVVEDTFEIDSRYGPLEFHVADVVGIDFRLGGNVSRSLEIQPSRTVPTNWLNTKVNLMKGQRLSIEASGLMNVANYNVSAGPDGTTRYSGSTFQNMPMLSLVGRVGKKGKAFKVGKSYDGKVGRSGTLYLGIVPFRRSTGITGSFKVKVEGAR